MPMSWEVFFENATIRTDVNFNILLMEISQIFGEAVFPQCQDGGYCAVPPILLFLNFSQIRFSNLIQILLAI